MAIVPMNQVSTAVVVGHGVALGTGRVLQATPVVKVAWSFIPLSNPFNSGDVNLSEVKLYVGAATGNCVLKVSVYEDNIGKPNTAGSPLTNGVSNNSIALNAAYWVTFTWATPPTLTVGTQYWLVIEYVSGTSATVVPMYTTLNAALMLGSTTASNAYGFNMRVDDGTSAWAVTSSGGVFLPRLTFTNGTDIAHFGMPSQGTQTRNAAGTGDSNTEQMYSTGARTGVKFTTPNTKLRITAAALRVVRNGTATTGSVTAYLYRGDETTPLAVSYSIPYTLISSGNFHTWHFPSTIELLSNSPYRVVFGYDAGVRNSVYYYISNGLIDPDSAHGGTVNLMPWQHRFCRLNGTTWTDTYNNDSVGFILFMNNEDEFGISSTGGASSYTWVG